MIPTNSSSDSNGCNNISSNCVVWQGPDISCINLCTGDTVSDVVAALATKLCELTDGISNEPDLTGFDLKCALPTGATPTTLVENLQAIITYICSLPTTTGTPYVEPNIALCADLKYARNDGSIVDSLPLSEYALLVGNKVCNIVATITTIQTQLTDVDNRLTVVESYFPITTTEVQIVPGCVTATAGVLTNVSVVVSALETAFCSLQTATGTPAVINNAVGQQAIANAFNLLSNPSTTYSAQTGWQASPVNMGNSLQNAWIVIKDLYDAVQAIQTNCCPGACESLTFDFSISRLLDSNALTTHIVVDFSGATIPAGFTDTGGTTAITVTDSSGNVTVKNVNISSLANTSPFTTNVAVTSIDENSQLTVVIDSSFTKDSDVCQTLVTKVEPASIPCPTTYTFSSITNGGFTVAFDNILGTTAVYTLKVREGSYTAPVLITRTVTNPGTTVTESFTGLTANTTYVVEATIVYQGVTKVCVKTGNVKTADTAPPCNQGIDVVFLFDYTSSMGPDMNTAKAAATSLISTIKSASGHPTYEYRIGLALYDETGGQGTNPQYNNQSNYTSLPAAQRVHQNGLNTTLHFTAMEMLQANNETSFTAQLNKLNNGGNLSMGSGNLGPEPGLPALSEVVTGNLCGAFRTNVAKIIILLTDDVEGGTDDTSNATDVAQGAAMATLLNNNGIKFIAMGPGALATTNGTAIYEVLANATGGSATSTFSAAAVQTAITNACGT